MLLLIRHTRTGLRITLQRKQHQVWTWLMNRQCSYHTLRLSALLGEISTLYRELNVTSFQRMSGNVIFSCPEHIDHVSIDNYSVLLWLGWLSTPLAKQLDELNVYLQILCFRNVARVSSNDDHLWIPFLTKYNHSYNIAQPSLMITFSTNSHDI